MRPAFSVIFLTTLIGAGQGLFLALFTADVYGDLGLLPRPVGGFFAGGAALALVLMGLGLVASFFHLGRPERGWRAAARWRTSWLSREVIVLPAFMGALALYGAGHQFGATETLFTVSGVLRVDWTLVVGTVTALLCFLLFLCTGMIYACLKFLREWATPLTPVNYLLLGSASGFTLATAYAAVAGVSLAGFFGGWAIIITVLAFLTRGAALARNRGLKPVSTLQTAIGVRHPRIAQKAQGAMGGSFNTREFFHGRSAQVVTAVQWTFLALA
ncbi:MAG TPA: DmsC/YnfH family molybdoenzyme membrane anchor subunit, partial [Burkholderiales bacterium]